jgi:hypothetical protein
VLPGRLGELPRVEPRSEKNEKFAMMRFEGLDVQ